jgi:predicted nuclease of restriction endonuclease-like (RecB) superfamily
MGLVHDPYFRVPGPASSLATRRVRGPIDVGGRFRLLAVVAAASRMSKPPTKPSKLLAALPADYAPLLAEIKARVQSARVKAGLAANRELLALYWDIGRLILGRQRKEGWGTKVIDRLSVDLQREFPGQQGFSPRNLKYMRAFAEAWPETAIVQPPVAQLTERRKFGPETVQEVPAQLLVSRSAIVQAPLAQLPWYHHLALLDKLSMPADRLWYAAKAVEHGWSRSVLALQIDAGLHTREGKAVTNFKSTLPLPWRNWKRASPGSEHPPLASIPFVCHSASCFAPPF